MFTPLISITIDSIYNNRPLPARLAHCTPDMFAAITTVARDLQANNARLVLSDLFRSYDMQFQAHQDYVSGKKSAYSPPPGGSMHEAGRAFDLDLDKIKRLTLAKFWEIAGRRLLTPIIDSPNPGVSEAWHFDCRGSHGLVYDYYKAGKGNNFRSPYTAMAASGIVSIGQVVDALGPDIKSAYVQSGLIRLGRTIGNLDGGIGPKTRDALAEIGIDPARPLDEIADAVDRKLQEAFPTEFFVPGPVAAPAELLAGDIPAHLMAVMAPALADAAPPQPDIAYRPHPTSRPLLGSIIEKLQGATPIRKDFVHPPRILTRLSTGELYFDSDLELDTDGSSIGNDGDPDFQAETSLRYANGRSLDANAVPFFVLPLPTTWSHDFGISLGDYAALIYNDFLAYAVFGDHGPKNKLGEGSIELLRRLGQERVKNGRIVNSGMGPGVISIVFPGSGAAADRADPATLKAAIASKAGALFTALGGVPNTAGAIA